MRISDRLHMFVLNNISRRMLCPSCRKNDMHLDKNKEYWGCNKCGYTLSRQLFESDYVFWFCDSCDTYLNRQLGFSTILGRWKCLECGHINTFTPDQIIGICKQCGKKLPDTPDATECNECRMARLERTRDILQTVSAVCKGLTGEDSEDPFDGDDD